jgi:putative tryptophan/tyrosine transport system substrate-binding protein
MQRREFIALIVGAAISWPSAIRAQQPAGIRHLGILLSYEEGNPAAQALLAAFREALTKLGWTEGKNIEFEYRWVGTDTNLMQIAAKELVALQPDVIIVPGSSPVTAYLLRQTRIIPILFINIIDPVGQGFVASLSRPGGNATGLVNLETSMAGKWLELLKAVMPRVARAVIPFNPASSPYADLYLNYFKSTAPSFGIEVVPAPIADVAAIEAVVAAQAGDPNTGIVAMPSAFTSAHASEFAEITTRYRVPTIYSLRSFAEAGGLLSYGNDIIDNYRRAATFVDRILKGEKPSELPVQFPTKFELVINLKTAKTLGLTVPVTLQASADKVIE